MMQGIMVAALSSFSVLCATVLAQPSITQVEEMSRLVHDLEIGAYIYRSNIGRIDPIKTPDQSTKISVLNQGNPSTLQQYSSFFRRVRSEPVLSHLFDVCRARGKDHPS